MTIPCGRPDNRACRTAQAEVRAVERDPVVGTTVRAALSGIDMSRWSKRIYSKCALGRAVPCQGRPGP
jgi:hypothetical protein